MGGSWDYFLLGSSTCVGRCENKLAGSPLEPVPVETGTGMTKNSENDARIYGPFLWTIMLGFGNLSGYEKRCLMCLGIPAKVVEIDESKEGKVDYLGTKVRTNLSLIQDIKLGDWVIVHAGFAISKLEEDEAQETLAMLREIAEKA